jgi:hypothetical protein
MYKIGAGAVTDLIRNLYSQLSSKGTQFPNIDHPADYEAKLFQAFPESDAVKRKALSWELVQMAIDKYCMVTPLYAAYDLCINSPEVHDCDIGAVVFNQWHSENTWLSK